MAFPRRAPARIASELFDCIDEKNGRASKWDLIKIVGNESQFHHWVEDFLLREKFVEGQLESNYFFYRKTETGVLLHRLLKNGKIMQVFLKISGRKLRY
jgi:hypothetical protein